MKFRTFWRRFWAAVIDGMLFLPLPFATLWVFSNVGARGVLAAWFVLSSLSFYVYSVLMHGRFGQTVGKMVTRVRVLDLSESPLSMRQALLRDLVPIGLVVVAILMTLPSLLRGSSPSPEPMMRVATWINENSPFAWFLAELVTMLTNAKRRALHDLIAGSVVVRVDPTGTPDDFQGWLKSFGDGGSQGNTPSSQL